jgi:molybdate transport system ATP-binding protein
MESSNPLPLVVLENVSVKLNGLSILENISLTICRNEQWAVVGKSGSGKTTLAKALTGRIFHSGSIDFRFDKDNEPGSVILIEQQHHFKNLSNTSDFYYQQRFNSSDADDAITVAEAMGSTDSDWIDILNLSPLLPEPLIQLSNGENKRLQLAKALTTSPNMLILDNPFTGLDTEGRKTLHGIFDTIAAKGIHFLIITNPQELPRSITHVAELDRGKLIWAGKKEQYDPAKPSANHFLDPALLENLPKPANTDFIKAIEMIDVQVKYGEKIILQKINWTVLKGERWGLSGPNGAGKSTLLSLILADNPQAYPNKIWLFDKRRGTGESIWDIKKRIGYVSPELHLFFDQSEECFNVIASGIFDTMGLFRNLTDTQKEQVNTLAGLLSLNGMMKKRLFQLSLGEQRMALLARALVKNPPLLVLDEPCQGLAIEQTEYFKNLVDQVCTHFGTTLLYVSHYAKDIPTCVDHSLKLEGGSIIS